MGRGRVPVFGAGRAVGRAGMVALLGVLVGCGGGARVTKTPGEEVVCERPGAEALRTFGASVKLDDVMQVVKASASVETKVAQIRRLGVQDAGFDVVAWRLCESYQNGLITKDDYKKFMLIKLEATAR